MQMEVRPLRPVQSLARTTLRLLLASVGGYALAVAVAFVAARGLPMVRAEAVAAATLLAIPAMPAAAIWVYGASRLRDAAAGLVGAILLCAAFAWLIGGPP